MAKQTKPTHFTNPCRSLHVHLNKPDTKFKDDGEFSVRLIHEENEADKIKAMLDEAVDKLYDELQESDEIKAPAKKKMKKEIACLTEEYDDEDNLTGRFLCKYSTNATYKDRKSGKTRQKKVRMYDSGGNACFETIWAGSLLRVRYTVGATYVAGTGTVFGKLYLSGVQIVDLVGPSSSGSGDGGFGAVPDGFVSDREAEEKPEDESVGSGEKTDPKEDDFASDGF